MALRLFHITEFAQSMLSPAAQRQARHPALLLLRTAVWIAIVGNLPLWRELAQVPLDAMVRLWSDFCFLLLSIAALATAFSACNWPFVLRPVLTLTLWVTVCNTMLLWIGPAGLTLSSTGLRAAHAQLAAQPWWALSLAFGLLALLPTVLIWRARLRRIPVLYLLSQNLLLAVSFTLLLGLAWLVARGALLPLLQDQPRWLELISPFNLLMGLRLWD